ncbi:MAG TPA: hypothetical protein VGS23_07970 [Thermoplasmata archaeon]|nr:hypothetical protein [Thermoplasmata archaeon]
MNLHRVRRLAEILTVSQFRSGRTTSDPRGFLGQPYAVAVLDAGIFGIAVALVALFVRAAPLGATFFASASNSVFPFLPLFSLGAVLVGGVMFELTTTAKFAVSDAANWLPISASEYVVASSSAIAYSYSPFLAAVLGGLLPIAAVGGVLTGYAFAAFLALLGLYEGGVLIEMVRALSQRSSSLGSGRSGSISIVLRVGLIVVMILVFDLAFNPAFLLGFLDRFPASSWWTGLVPFLWSTRGLADWTAGFWLGGIAFAIGQVAFVGLLAYAAGLLRRRYWVPSGGDLEMVGSSPPTGHPFLRSIGLSEPEAALVSKDLRGLVRRREMLPILALPIVLVVLLLFEGPALGSLGAVVWVGWVAGFFALLIATRSIGQERRSFPLLYAFPIRPRAVLRAKAASIVLPSAFSAVVLTIFVGVLQGLGPFEIAGLAVVNIGAAALLSVWGLVFAARYSDFEDRPRPQFLAPGAMLGALGSGMGILFPILIPATLAIVGAPTPNTALLVGWAVGFAAVIAGVSTHWALVGFDRLFREVPF